MRVHRVPLYLRQGRAVASDQYRPLRPPMLKLRGIYTASLERVLVGSWWCQDPSTLGSTPRTGLPEECNGVLARQ